MAMKCRYLAVLLVHLSAVAYFAHLGVTVWHRVGWEPMASVTASLVIVPLPAILFMIHSTCTETDAERVLALSTTSPEGHAEPFDGDEIDRAGPGQAQAHHHLAWSMAKSGRCHCKHGVLVSFVRKP